MNRFKHLHVIGEGSFGVVYLAEEQKTKSLVAIKKMKRRYNSWEECMNLREVRSLRRLRNPFIIKLREVFREENQLHLVFDYMESNLFKHYSSKYKEQGKQIPEEFIRKTVYQTLKGIAHLHDKGFFHRDLKPENLLVDSNGDIKIADFGLAREIRSMPPYTDYISTRWYRAPEMLLKMPNYSHPVDIFAIGCIMAELYLEKPIFDGKSELDQLHKIFNILGDPGTNWKEGVNLSNKLGIQLAGKKEKDLKTIIKRACPQGINLLKKMFQLDPLKRGSAQSLLSHEYFRCFQKEKQIINENGFVGKVDTFKSEIDENRLSNLIDLKFKNVDIEKENTNNESEVSPSMRDFYSSRDENSLMENKSMTDEIEKIINQQDNLFFNKKKYTGMSSNLKKQNLNTQNFEYGARYKNLNMFSLGTNHSNNILSNPFGKESFKNTSKRATYNPYSLKKSLTHSKNLNIKNSKPFITNTTETILMKNKENLKQFSVKEKEEDLLPSYMRFMGGANSNSEFKFHF